MTDDRECEQTRELIPELAADVASGDERAATLRHVAACPACQRRLDDSAAMVDRLVALAPPHEPPVGFEARVLAEIAPRRPRTSRRRWTAVRAAIALAVSAVVAAALSAGVVWQATAGDRGLARDYRNTLTVADGRYLTAAVLYASHERVGHVFGYQGSPSWLFVTVDSRLESGTYDVSLVTRDGHQVRVGSMTITNGRGSWGVTIVQPIAQVARVMFKGNGTAEMTAKLH
ncbi:anti-sigma factor family protein [Microtetraspora malaysiensis]|uniref:anti-sigma factor family protein n=1 Tax=Microtetraspora malaysiensis TaxID=161358 RepID=UPI00082DFDF1|nr:anti-sigma factor [Microtetraspora malaysiensis]